MEEIKFTLSKPVEYTTDSGLKKSKELILKPFNIRDHKSITIELRQMFFRAINGINRQSVNSNTNDESAEMTASGILIALNMSESINVEDFYNKAEELLCSGVVYVEKNIQLTKGMILEIQENDFQDYEFLIGEYLANFLITSWMKRLGMN